MGEEEARTQGRRRRVSIWKLLINCFCPSINEPLLHHHSIITRTTSSSSSSSSRELPNGRSEALSPIYSNNILNESQRVTPASSKAMGFPFTPKRVEDLRNIEAYGNVVLFSHQEIQQATKSFRPDLIIGEGGFGIVYKGIIDDSTRFRFDNTAVAVKVLNPNGYQGDREWLAEVNHLGQFSHPNLVKLIGYCCEDAHRILVYEYMAGGCVERHLFRRNSQTMSWEVRIKIALGAAKGLAFLHGNERPVIYRDFKTENILLDEDFNAKLSDFGLAKEGPSGDKTHVSTRVLGTYGYAAPEYVMTGHLTARSDVYSYGVVLLEMLLGRRATDGRKVIGERSLVDWARPLLVRSRMLLKIIDPRMEGQYTVRCMRKMATLAYRCLSLNPKERPTMNQVVQFLEAIQELCNQKPAPTPASSSLGDGGGIIDDSSLSLTDDGSSGALDGIIGSGSMD